MIHIRAVELTKRFKDLIIIICATPIIVQAPSLRDKEKLIEYGVALLR